MGRRFWPGTLAGLALALLIVPATAGAETLEVFHADSLAGPFAQITKVFERANSGVTVVLTSGRSQELAERILKGERCDVFASSTPAIIEQDLMKKVPMGRTTPGATWSVVFSANEMVVITAKGNPHGIQHIVDLVKPGVRFVRVTGEKDLGTNRTIEFVKRAARREGAPDLAERIIASAVVDPTTPTTVPDTVRAVAEGKADAGVVYYSAAMAASNAVEIIRFPPEVNLADAIRNAATVPATAANRQSAVAFIKLLLTTEGREMLEKAGQPPVIPPIGIGAVPADLN